MELFDNGRDKNWLKTITDFPLSGFYIAEDDKVAGTIVREMSELFSPMSVTDKANAGVLFCIVENPALGTEGYLIERSSQQVVVKGNTTVALLYGMYGLHRLIAIEKVLSGSVESVPDQSFRMLNHWDNFDGSIERGYAGESIFYCDNGFRNDFEVVRQYARFLASIGINALSVNNVNVHKQESTFITQERLTQMKPIYEIFAEYGVKMYLSINYASPILVGGLATADPCEPAVAAWWTETAKTIYRILPQLGGLLVKADSEGEPGPFSYGRNHDDGANMLARAVRPYGGIIIWRCFVYNCQQDWRDRSIDRARAQYDNFIGLDGCFDENVILQIKNGPIDFQVREPVSPLFGALKNTNQILEYQITQEYTGQQKHVFYLLPTWKTVLDYDTKHEEQGAVVADVVRKNSPVKKNSGIAAVVNVGMDTNWTGHKLAQANLYGFGRMIWDNRLSSEAILDEWIALSFALSAAGQEKLKRIMMSSAEVYENYTAPNGIGFMVTQGHHYGPAVDGYEYDRWGTYHFADRKGVGVDRTLATGTGYSRQYSDLRFTEYEDLRTCPDELLLFFHHVPYTHRLTSGQTLIQSIYDTHFKGVEQVEQYIRDWESLKDELAPDVYGNVRERLDEQHCSAKEWRDQINTYFYRKSGIADELGRVIYP